MFERTHSHQPVIPRMDDDYKEQTSIERNPVDGELAMKRFSQLTCKGHGIPLKNVSIFIDCYGMRGMTDLNFFLCPSLRR
jgi:hypothetical protein